MTQNYKILFINALQNWIFLSDEVRRDEKIISHLSDAQPYMGEYPCLIIYPEKQASDDLEVTRFNHEESLLQKARKINGFRNFYKLGG